MNEMAVEFSCGVICVALWFVFVFFFMDVVLVQFDNLGIPVLGISIIDQFKQLVAQLVVKVLFDF